MTLCRCRHDGGHLVETLQEELIAVQIGPVLGLMDGGHRELALQRECGLWLGDGRERCRAASRRRDGVKCNDSNVCGGPDRLSRVPEIIFCVRLSLSTRLGDAQGPRQPARVADAQPFQNRSTQLCAQQLRSRPGHLSCFIARYNAALGAQWLKKQIHRQACGVAARGSGPGRPHRLMYGSRNHISYP